jgi:signal peptidase I
MLGLFQSQEKRMRENAANWLEVASRVWNYRRDRMTVLESDELVQKTEALKGLVRENADAARLKLAIESLEGILARVGGAIYPKTSLSENVEFFLVAAIVILGIRSYFVQPFKIPTNSMWPTYYGMKNENFPPGTPVPNLAARALRFLAYGAQSYAITAPRDGEVVVPFFIKVDPRTPPGEDPKILSVTTAYTKRPGHSWLIFPAKVKEFTLFVDGVPATVRVPEDFNDFDDVLTKRFFPDTAALIAQVQKARAAGQIEEVTQKMDESTDGYYKYYRVPLGVAVKAGEPIVRFDILTGDQLFVDRISYNFVRPSVGSGFVFRTDNIPEIRQQFGDPSYFIKRLIGVPGDQIELKAPGLYRNGAPITGSAVFQLNAKQVAPYRGYQQPTTDDPQFRQLFAGEVITVPEHGYLAMGDNSYNSFDGRYWGFVPEKDVVGRPLFIYYPFTRRWGTSK